MTRVTRYSLYGLVSVALAVLGLHIYHQHQQAAREWHWSLPKTFPQPRVPADNPMTEAKFQLGRRLFFDKRLSGNGTMACGNCHQQRLAFTDGRPVAEGSTGDHTARGAQSIANVAYYPTLTWANPSQFSLETQAAVPMFVDNLAVELGINDGNMQVVLARFRDDPDYQARFREAFAGEDAPVNYTNIIKAIATFERGVISANSRYDQAEAGKIKLTDAEERGRKLFFDERSQCSVCHGGFNFSDQTMDAGTVKADMPFHNIGLYDVDGNGAYPASNPGLIAHLPRVDNKGKFRSPGLRNVALTAPYMHDGSVATLEEVLAIFAAGGRNVESGPNKGDGRRNRFKAGVMDKIKLTPQEQADIVAFLKTLTDESLLTDPRYADPFAALAAK